MTGWAGIITASVLGAFWIAWRGLGMDEAHAVTVSFLTLAFAQLWHVFNMRSPGASFVRNEVTTSPWVWGALAFCTALLLAAVFFTPLAELLGSPSLGAEGLWLVAAMSLVPVIAGPLFSRSRPPDVRSVAD